MPTLTNTLDAAAFYSLSLVRDVDGWQASLAVERGNSFRIRHGATPSAAVEALFDLPRPIQPPPF